MSALAASSSSVPSIPGDENVRTESRKKRIGSPIGIFFAILTYLYAVPFFLVMVLTHPFVLLLDPKRRRFHDGISIWWMKSIMITCLLFPKIRGLENLPPRNQACIFVPNHTSFLDIFVLGWIDRGKKFVSKAKNFRIPIVGTAMRFQGHISLEEGSRKAQIQCYKDIIQSLESGNNLTLFPEGTRSKDGRLKRFQSGAFKAAIQTSSPVVPITILGTREVYPSGALVPIRYPFKRMEAIIHPAIDPAGKTDREISQLAFDAINSALPDHLKVINNEASDSI
eukprot:CAMPEP_0184685498 /NCGR_PEP_ID=MMETSP0312-20130426/19198_1 /TAXON_ID=31354 /ORGANISM="Compsopogon coeruleus, Strain SAG 36.94" /LENGTH=281 /DNA_ID=CAMNT_0027139657 /DNA_START=310 /DNA_END=1155 /DNA_ORIENTATION=-